MNSTSSRIEMPLESSIYQTYPIILEFNEETETLKICQQYEMTCTANEFGALRAAARNGYQTLRVTLNILINANTLSPLF